MTTAFRRTNKLSDQSIRYISEKSIVIAGKSKNKKTLAFIETLKLDYATKSFRQLARREAYDIVNKGNGIFKASWDKRPSASQFGTLREASASLGTPLGKDIFINWVKSVIREGRKEIHQTHGNRQRLTHSASAQTKTFACCSSPRHCPASVK